MKKTLSVVALIAISASLVACGGEKKEAAPAEAPAVVEQPAAPATTEAAPATTEAAPAPATTEAAPAPAATEAAPAK
jgi:hypothetical protein